MKKPIVLTSDSAIINDINFKPYRSAVERRVSRFLPKDDEPQTLDVHTPWGEVLTARAGDYLVSELDKPDDMWPVKSDIFVGTYIILRDGYCVKAALTDLAPMTEVTNGDPDAQVTVITLEGPQTVRAGDFYLARGVKGELWSYPKEKIGVAVLPAD